MFLCQGFRSSKIVPRMSCWPREGLSCYAGRAMITGAQTRPNLLPIVANRGLIDGKS
jgi:hypothetical protein